MSFFRLLPILCLFLTAISGFAEISLSPNSVPAGTMGVPYTNTLKATGGVGTYGYAQVAGNLPNGLTLSDGGVLSGTPTASGSFSFTVRVTDGASTSKDFPLSLFVANPSGLLVTTTALPDAQVGQGYTASLAATGGSSSGYTWNVVSGTPPPGIFIIASGLFQGSASTAGTYNFTVEVTDSGGSKAQAALSIRVNSNALTISTPSLASGSVGASYSQSLSASGGLQPYFFSVSAGTLPLGLSITSSGLISGTPSAVGTANFTVRVADGSGQAATKPLSITIAAAQLAINQTALPSGQLGQVYSSSVGAVNGTAPYTFSIIAGALPAGISFASNGVFSGTPTVPGSYPFTVQVRDNTNATASASFSIAVNSNSLTITTTSLPNGVLSQNYQTSIIASGGVTPYTFQILSGNTPPGLSLSTTGSLAGIPSAVGTYTFLARVSDNSGSTVQRELTVTVTGNGLSFVSTALPNGQLGQTYTATLTAAGGTTPYNYSIISGSLPPGLQLGATGGITGTPTGTGSYQMTFRVQDALGIVAQTTLSINVTSGSSLTITTQSLPSAVLNQPYNATISAAGGSPSYTFYVTAGALPNGLVLSSNGVISGIPNSSGTFQFTVLAFDSQSRQAQATFSISVNSSNIQIGSLILPSGTLNQPYSATVTATGGTSPYSYSITSGGLPTGLSMDNNGVLSGTPTASGNYNFTVRIQDAASVTASFGLSLSISSSTLAITTTSLPGGLVGSSYSGLILASGGTGPYLFEQTAGTLPAGLSLTQAGGISGIPTNAGTFNFTIKASDAASASTTANFSITINSAGSLTITTTSLPTGQVNLNYNVGLTAVGGSFPYSYSIKSGSLPPGLTLSGTGGITGLPTTPGNYGFVVQLNDNGGQSTQTALSIDITSVGFYISTTTLPTIQVGQFFTTTLSATGGSAPYSYTIVAGGLPNGVSLTSSGTLSGVASTSGSYPVTVRATDVGGATAQANLTLTVGSSLLTFTTTSLPQGYIGQQYNVQLQVAGGAAPYQFSLVGGILPSGLSLTFNGQILGTPISSSFNNLTFRVTDNAGGSATVALNLAIGQSTVQFLTTSLQTASVGQSYAVSLQASGGTTPYTFSLISGSLPNGITFSQSGLLSGTPTQAGSTTLGFRVTDSASATSTTTLVLSVVNSTLQITTNSLPGGRVGQAYSHTLQTTGGQLPVNFELVSTITSGFPPPGITISSGGVISGTPQSDGTFTFTVRATDVQNLSVQKTFTLVITQGGPSFTTTALPAGTVGQIYNQTLMAANGTAPYIFSLSSGILPPGVSLNPSGQMSGTPNTPGTFTFSLRVTDSAQQSADATFSVLINSGGSALAISALAPPTGNLFFSYSFALTATGGREPYTWAIPAGTIPNGLRLESTGTLNGLLLSPGIYRFTARVTDADNTRVEAPITITVNPANRLSSGTVGSAYSAQAPAPAVGRAPFTYTFNANALGDLPPGIILNANGSLTGTPTTAGEYTFGVLTQDTSGFRSNMALVLTVHGGNFSILTPSVPGATSGTPYSQTLTAAGGKEPYNWVIASGTLPNGLTLNPLNGQISGTPTIQGTTFFTAKVSDGNGTSAYSYFGISVAAPGSPVIHAITSAASYATNGVVPGELITLFGGTLGPQNLTSFSLVDGKVPSLLAATRVLFDGVPAPVIYTSYGQASVVTPFSMVSKHSVRVVVEYQTYQSTPFLLPVLSSRPGIFTVDSSGRGPGAILNQNSSVNSSSNRAAKESVVVLYLTGGGSMTPEGVEGDVSSGTSSLNQQTLVTINNQPATVQYSGNAPGLVQGVIQVNVKLPPGTVSGENAISVQIGPNRSNANVSVWVQ
ncbi:putative Ig domain-containing protein [Bryobacter aggregatus]|uniref:putative Ig domain-containing protein n=1 Tax=Bryobacter aggregatus TaxID=360054 RepID=UPI0004E10DC9|nr:putative Ig domain-containing protein [Bryobacter aggregatus]